MAPEPSLVLVICSEREAAGRLAAIIQGLGHRVVAAPYGSAALSRADEAQLILIDKIEGTVDAAQAITRIKATAQLAEIPLLAIAQTNEVDERVRLLESGADDVMARPFDPAELEARVDGLLVRARQLREPLDPSQPAGEPVAIAPRIICMFSPKGGVGTTTISVNVAVAQARAGRSVALVDMDLQWGQVATQLNLRPRVSVVELARDSAALGNAELVRSYAESHQSGVSVFCAPLRPDQGELISHEQAGRLLDALVGAYDLVVVDCGSTLDERTLTLFEHADRLVLVAAPEIPTVRAVHALLEVLTELGSPSERQFFVLNHLYQQDMLRVDDLERSLQATIQAELPYDPVAYLKAANEGVPLVMAGRGLAAERLERLAVLVAGEVPAPAAAPRPERPQKRLDLASLLKRS